jgi:hypothetical protein
LDFRFWILDFELKFRDWGFQISDFGSQLSNFLSGIQRSDWEVGYGDAKRAPTSVFDKQAIAPAPAPKAKSTLAPNSRDRFRSFTLRSSIQNPKSKIQNHHALLTLV